MARRRTALEFRIIVIDAHVKTRKWRVEEEPWLADLPDWLVGSVYFLRAGTDGLIKIGFTRRPVKYRLREIQQLCPVELSVVAVIPDADRGLERRLHRDFSHERVRGEWFESCDLLEGVIAHYAAAA
jgi:hypothetical protein